MKNLTKAMNVQLEKTKEEFYKSEVTFLQNKVFELQTEVLKLQNELNRYEADNEIIEPNIDVLIIDTPAEVIEYNGTKEYQFFLNSK